MLLKNQAGKSFLKNIFSFLTSVRKSDSVEHIVLERFRRQVISPNFHFKGRIA